MAFKLNYLFEGDFKNKPEQNFSGAARKLSRDALLRATYEERKKRQDHRLKIRSVEILQTHVRSYLARRRAKDEQREQYDKLKSAPLRALLPRLLFFYYPRDDRSRLVAATARLLRERDEVRATIRSDRQMFWLMRRYLSLCLGELGARGEDDDDSALVESLDVYTEDRALLESLIRKGYYKYLRSYLEKGTKHSDAVLKLIQRPFNYLSVGVDGYNDVAFGEFASTYLRPPLTTKVKGELLPYLKERMNRPVFVGLIEHLNVAADDDGDDLYYCVLALEPDDFEPNLGLVRILSRASRALRRLRPSTSRRNEDSDDDDEEEAEVIPVDESPMRGGQVLYSECLAAMNRPDRVRRWLGYLEARLEADDGDVLDALVRWCHNLLLDHREAIRRYMLLYKLGLNGRFLGRLCSRLRLGHAEPLQTRTLFQNAWDARHETLSVFCSMFIFYTETLTDEENSDTSGTFTKDDLSFASRLLKSVARETIEIAFPMSRTNSPPPMLETQQLYKVALSCLKTLYMLDLRQQFCPTGFWSSDKIFIPPDLGRNLSDVPLSSYSLFNGDDAARTNDPDEHMAPLSTIERRSLAVLEELPFLIPFNTRILLLRDLCRNINNETEYQRLHNEFTNDRAIVIRRTHIYEDAFEKLFNAVDLKRRTRIQFINSVGLEEAGIDGGGIFKEFLNEVLKTAFDPNRGFFLLTTNNTLYPNPNVHLIVDNYLEHFYFIGRLIGKAIFENILVELPLAEFFLAKLVVDRAPAHYLKSLDPLLYKNLLYLRDCTGDISDLGLDFTIVNYDLGETRLVELKPDGRNIPVTNENRLEYIQRLADFKLNGQLNKQCFAFRMGISSVIPIRWLKFFDHKELQVIIGGNNQDVDVDDLKAHTLYGGEFTEVHPTIVHFWNVLRSFTDTQKRQLLKFVTSCSRPPLLGFKELNPEFCILSSGTENRMPTASTCLNLLKLPIIEDEETLREKLLEAVQQQAGFELS